MARNLGAPNRARSISPGTQQKIVGIKGENPLKNRERPNYDNT